jgi:hypothetical protein
MRTLLIPTGFLFMAGLALADTAPKFDQLDRNGDGVLLPEEAEGALSVDFGQADTNGDGGLSRSEYASAAKRAGKPEEVDAG